MLPILTILHPTDFSDCSEYARQLAASLARDYGARLVVVHVAPVEIDYSGLIGGTCTHWRRSSARPSREIATPTRRST
jgi:nucleotide-binding universal stress UspA family protein